MPPYMCFSDIGQRKRQTIYVSLSQDLAGPAACFHMRFFFTVPALISTFYAGLAARTCGTQPVFDCHSPAFYCHSPVFDCHSPAFFNQQSLPHKREHADTYLDDLHARCGACKGLKAQFEEARRARLRDGCGAPVQGSARWERQPWWLAWRGRKYLQEPTGAYRSVQEPRIDWDRFVNLQKHLLSHRKLQKPVTL